MKIEWPFLLAQHKSTVGVSLLAIAVYQPPFAVLTHRYREQAHSYKGFCVECQFFRAFQILPTTETTANTTAPAMIPATPLSNIGTANPTLPAAAPTPSIQ